MKKWLGRFILCTNPCFYAINLLLIVIITLISFCVIFTLGQGLISCYQSFIVNYNELLGALVTVLWLYVFSLITILPLSLFSALYIYFTSAKTSKIRQYLISYLGFFESLPEFLIAIFAFSFFTIFFKIANHSIFLFGLSLFLVIFPLIFFIILEALNTLGKEYNLLFREADNKIKFLIFTILPKISPYIIFYALRILLFVNSIGFALFAFNNFSHNMVIPTGFSDSGASLMQKIYLDLMKNYDNGLFISIIFFSLLINLLFAYFESLIKKLFITKTQF